MLFRFFSFSIYPNFLFFFFNDTATTEIYTLSLHDALPISGLRQRAKACIVLFMWGGPAQQDTWDMKPDAPEVYRGQFKPIQTTVPGLQVCEHLPLLAKRAHELCLIRSTTHNDVNHTTATHPLLTGRAAPPGGLADDFPNYGAVLSKLGRGRGPLPPY